MIIEFKMDADGGFYAMNVETGHVEYAFSSSYYAKLAKSKPRYAAIRMLGNEQDARNLRDHEERNAYLRSQMIAA